MHITSSLFFPVPFRVVEERCGKWWLYWWAGPLTYIHLIDVEVPEWACGVVLPVNLIGLNRGSVPVACVPLTYKLSEDKWWHGGLEHLSAEGLAEKLEGEAPDYPHWCLWVPHWGPLPPGVYDAELLAEALRRMPALAPSPEELAVDFVDWSFPELADFLRSDYVVYPTGRVQYKREKWREICEHDDPRQCYPGALGERLAVIKFQRNTVPAMDSSLFGKRYARPWGYKHVTMYYKGRVVRVYYVLGHLLRGVLEKRNRLTKQSYA